MLDFMHFIRQFTVWLHYPLFEYGLFYIDLWSLVHFWSGLMVFIGLTVLGWKNRWGWLTFFLTAFEVLEATIFISVMRMFRPEKLPDCFTDILIGLAGGYLVYFLFEKRKITSDYSRIFIFFLAAGVVSFLWTGNSGYLFDTSIPDAYAMNWGIFCGWLLAGILILYFYAKMRFMNFSVLKSIALTWITSLAPLLILVSCDTNLGFSSGIMKENYSSLISFLPVNATKTFFYLTSPFLFILLYILLTTLFEEHKIRLRSNETSHERQPFSVE